MNKKGWFALLLFWMASSVLAQDPKTYIHPRAVLYAPIFLSEQIKYFPAAPEPAYPIALAEHETCITLKHSKCLNPQAELKTSREQGSGLLQITRAWKKDGTLRFDSLQAMKDAHDQELRDLSWDNVKQRPDLQIRMMVLMIKDTYARYKVIKDPFIRYQFADSDYNGGYNDIHRARIACNLAKDCDPQIWFDNVEKYNPKSDTIMPGYGRSPRQINNHHVRDVFEVRLPKYQKYIKTIQGGQQ